ncbi:MAG TPA: TOBE domain-containing protein [Candidatus Acidoferrales bacterium]|nr:TOBE domain-containing protein [Candidatus Acidoferrales bacterium]
MKRIKLFTAREAAQILGLSYSALKQWIYKKKIGTVKTGGGHYRISEQEIDRFLYRAGGKRGVERRREDFRSVSGRNRLIGRIVDVKVDGFIAQVRLSIGGQQITSLITADAARELRLKKGETAAALIKATSVMLVRP